jgi:hypothetical protein
MSLADLVDRAKSRSVTPDGDRDPWELWPASSEAEIAELEARLPCALPSEIRELLTYCRGFTCGATDFVDFTGAACSFEHADLFPHGLPIAADGCGNFWVVDLTPDSRTWGPIYIACHDPRVVLYQSPNLEHFLCEMGKASAPPYESLLNDVHEDRPFDVWRKNPGVKSHAECLAAPDTDLRAFAGTLGPEFEIIDLREAKVGFGLSWGRYGNGTVIRRHGMLPIFACAGHRRRR